MWLLQQASSQSSEQSYIDSEKQPFCLVACAIKVSEMYCMTVLRTVSVITPEIVIRDCPDCIKDGNVVRLVHPKSNVSLVWSHITMENNLLLVAYELH